MPEDGSEVLYRETDGIAYLTLNRPDKLNALGPASFRRLDERITRFTHSPQARVAILHGNGRAFAAGADIEHYVGLSVLEYADFMRLGNGVQQHLIGCPKPVIAAVHGFALGGGLELALCCGLIVAAPDAQLGLPEAQARAVARRRDTAAATPDRHGTRGRADHDRLAYFRRAGGGLGAGPWPRRVRDRA